MEQVTGIVLAGGAGSRLGGRDKGLEPHAGRPLVEHVLERLRPQVDAVLISCNRNVSRYAGFGFPVVTDRMPLYSGPLAGLDRALQEVTTPLCITVPCDNPELPMNLVERLAEGLESAPGSQLAVAHDGQRLQPLYALLRSDLKRQLHDWLQAGGRAPRHWYPELGMQTVCFDDCAESFQNLNTLEQLNDS